MVNYQEIANADISAGLNSDNVRDAWKNATMEERRSACTETSLPFEVAVINVTGELNVGNIIRTSSLCGAKRVHVLGRRKFDRRGAVGSDNYIDVRRVDLMEDDLNVDIQAVAAYFDTRNLYPIFVEQNQRSYPLEKGGIGVAVTIARCLAKTPCFIFGNEGRGIPTELIDRYPESSICLEVAMRGVIRSHNVGSTAAIVLHEAMVYFMKEANGTLY